MLSNKGNENHVILDISGKVPYYDHELCTSLFDYCQILLLTPYDNKGEYSAKYPVKSLIRLFDHKKQNAGKLTKAIEGLINYLYFGLLLLMYRYDDVHLQWLPYMEYTSIEKYILKFYRLISPKTRFILTQHNIYPHGSSQKQKLLYRKRFLSISKFIDHYVVHTESSKIALMEEFEIEESKVTVIPHGVFIPEHFPIKKTNDSKKRILMFGVQSYYKGTDIFIDAVAELPYELRKIIEVSIVGKSDNDLFEVKKKTAYKVGINWVPRYLEDDELNQVIMDSDILVFPYRSISQSGALLLALAFEKKIIVSKLPSFLETLNGLPESSFVDVGSIDSLKTALIYAINTFNDERSSKILKDLKNKYSWKNSAKKTSELYMILNKKVDN